MMDWLWHLDRGWFREIHGAVQDGPFEGPLLLLTNSGLGHVQLAALLASAVRARLGSAAGWASAAVLLGALAAVTGEPMQAAAAVLLGALVWRLDWTTCANAVLAGIAAGAARLLLVGWVDRMRPSNFVFAHPAEAVYGTSSFPSGHATTSFAIAFAVLLTGPSRGNGWALVAWAVAVGVSRSALGLHYPTDVMGGAALGLIAAAGVAALRRRQASGEVPTASA